MPQAPHLVATLLIMAVAVCAHTEVRAQAASPVGPPTSSAPTVAPLPAEAEKSPPSAVKPGTRADEPPPVDHAPPSLRASEKDERWTGRDWAALFSGVASVLAFFAALRATQAAQRSNEANLAQKANEAEMIETANKLDNFYGPYLRLSETNRLLHQDLRTRQGNPAQFRTLLLMLDPEWRQSLTGGDQTIIDEIVRIDGQLELLIRHSAGIVDAAVQPYLARASAHFRMLRLAHKGKLGNDPARFAKYAYPRTLIAVLELEVRRLEARRAALRAHPSIVHGPIPALVIPEHLHLDTWT